MPLSSMIFHAAAALHLLLAIRGGHSLSTRSLSALREADISSQSSAEAKVPPESRNVAVCIAGQLSRLEIDSKMENVLKVLSQTGRLVHVFVAVETGGQTQFSNSGSVTDVAPNFTKEEVERKFKPFYQAGSFQPHVDHSADPDRWLAYLMDKPSLNRTERLSHHFSEQANLKACVDLIEQRETQLGIRYNVVIKLRDNTIIPRPYKLFSAHDLNTFSAKNSVLVKNCSRYRGVNNKVMVLPREHLAAALGGVYSVLMGVEKGDRDLINTFALNETLWNDETLLKKVLEFHKVPVLETNSTILPFVDGRCHSKDSIGKITWCQVSHQKDCWPPQPWNIRMPGDCDFNTKDT